MFRRKEESLFDNEFAEDSESFTVQASPSSAASSAETPSLASAAAPTPISATTVAPSTASVQPITRPSSPIPVGSQSSNFRPNMPVSNTSVSSPVPRPAEVKPMTPSSSSAPNTKVSSRVLTVGNDILLKGEINSCDRLVIEGKLEATLNDVHTVELAECGSFKGSANVQEAQISGLFEGDLVVSGRLVIYASGKVRGNISYGEIEIERGGELSGSIKAAGGSSASSSLPKALQKAAA